MPSSVHPLSLSLVFSKIYTHLLALYISFSLIRPVGSSHIERGEKKRWRRRRVMMLERWSDAQTGHEWENKNLCAVIASLVKSQSNLNICCPPAAVPSLFLLFFFLSPPPLCHLIRASITWQRRVVQITGGRWDSEFLEVKLFCGPFSLQCSLFS